MPNQLRNLPSVDRIFLDTRVKKLVSEFSRRAVLRLVRDQLKQSREIIKCGGSVPNMRKLVDCIEERAEKSWTHWPRTVINATGVILHTNLGRAPLSSNALESVARAGREYSDLEFDLETATRGSRQAFCTDIIKQVTGAEAALVVNNNASAILLGLASIANGKEVVISRGEAVEIGGGFRIPSVLRQSGAHLVEVGTTNRTYVDDFANVISEETGALLSVHSSNFKVTGFTHMPSLPELVALGEQRGIPVLHDLGSGSLLDTADFGLMHEPTPQESVTAGVSLAFFSGDKLLGGPQAGIIVGRSKFIDTVMRHPLARAVRIDKLNLAALTATLLHYLKNEAEKEIPIWQMISQSLDTLEIRAQRWQKNLGLYTEVVPGFSAIGGGSLPGETLPTALIRVNNHEIGVEADIMCAELRKLDIPVIARIEHNNVLLDPRTVLPDQEETLLTQLGHVLKRPI